MCSGVFLCKRLPYHRFTLLVAGQSEPVIGSELANQQTAISNGIVIVSGVYDSHLVWQRGIVHSV